MHHRAARPVGCVAAARMRLELRKSNIGIFSRAVVSLAADGLIQGLPHP